jgi:hypothetical protein
VLCFSSFYCLFSFPLRFACGALSAPSRVTVTGFTRIVSISSAHTAKRSLFNFAYARWAFRTERTRCRAPLSCKAEPSRFKLLAFVTLRAQRAVTGAAARNVVARRAEWH